MDVTGFGRRVRIYVGESDQNNGQPLFMAILQVLREEGCAGATVLRGIAGFGAGSRIHTATILRLSEDLPVVIEWVDQPDRVERVLPKVESMVSSGLITVEDIEVVHYTHRAVHNIGDRLRVREVMSRDIGSVQPEAPVRDAVEMLLNRGYRALPVVDRAGRIVGIVTNGDLVERGGLRIRLEMLRALSPEALREELRSLGAAKTVADVMTREVTTVGPEATLSDVAHLMVVKSIKRVPVVDRQGRLQGMISRVDLLRSVSESYVSSKEEGPLGTGRTVGEVMRTSVPSVREDASLGEVLDSVVSSRLNRAIVVDGAGRVKGVISDAEVVRRLSPQDRPGVVRVLMDRLLFNSLSDAERRRLGQSTGSIARDLMDPSVPLVARDVPVEEAIGLMLREQHKVLAVADADGKFLGAVDRGDLLRTVATPQAGEDDQPSRS